MTGYLPLIGKYSVTHMHSLALFAKEELPFSRDLYLENSENSYLCFHSSTCKMRVKATDVT